MRVSDTVGYSDYSNILKTTFGSIPDNLNPPILEELNADNRNNKIPYIKVLENSNNDDSNNGYKLDMKLSSDDDSTISIIYEDTNINQFSYTLYQKNNYIIVGKIYYFYISGKNEREY